MLLRPSVPFTNHARQRRSRFGRLGAAVTAIALVFGACSTQAAGTVSPSSPTSTTSAGSVASVVPSAAAPQGTLKLGYFPNITHATAIVGVEGEIFNFGISAGYDLQKCNTASVTHVCTWEDQACHFVTTAQQIVVQKGYQRRRCNDNGDYTAWLKDFEHRVPTKFADPSCKNFC